MVHEKSGASEARKILRLLLDFMRIILLEVIFRKIKKQRIQKEAGANFIFIIGCCININSRREMVLLLMR